MANDSWATPMEVYAALNAEFQFCADMAASEENAKHHIFWSEDDIDLHTKGPGHSLAIDWADTVIAATGGQWVWCNPPYSNIGPWVDKAIEAQRKGLGTVMLVMADPSVAWFAKAAEAATEIRFITRGRLAFLENGKPKGGNKKGSVFLIFAPMMIGNPKVTFVNREDLLERGRQLINQRAAA